MLANSGVWMVRTEHGFKPNQSVAVVALGFSQSCFFFADLQRRLQAAPSSCYRLENSCQVRERQGMAKLRHGLTLARPGDLRCSQLNRPTCHGFHDRSTGKGIILRCTRWTMCGGVRRVAPTRRARQPRSYPFERVRARVQQFLSRGLPDARYPTSGKKSSDRTLQGQRKGQLVTLSRKASRLNMESAIRCLYLTGRGMALLQLDHHAMGEADADKRLDPTGGAKAYPAVHAIGSRVP